MILDPRCLLYVEDEPDDVLFMQIAFQRVGAAAQLQSVFDGVQALDYLRGKSPFDDRGRYPFPSAVLLDLDLPLLSGFEVLEWIRGEPSCCHLPVVVFSSSGHPSDRQRAESLGADDYWLKPSSGTQFELMAKQLQVRWLARS